MWWRGTAFSPGWAGRWGRRGDRDPWVGVSLARVNQPRSQACLLLRKVGSLLWSSHRRGPVALDSPAATGCPGVSVRLACVPAGSF